ncbi:MAG: glycogen synthase GlgA, partial [Planctomycetota bacterium]
TGFSFGQYSAEALVDAVRRALDLYSDRDKWRRLMLNGMAQDWSWQRSAREYVAVYETARRKLRQQVSI